MPRSFLTVPQMNYASNPGCKPGYNAGTGNIQLDIRSRGWAIKRPPGWEEQVTKEGAQEVKSDELRASERRVASCFGAKGTAKYKIAGGACRLYALILGDCLAPSPEDYN